MKKTLIEVEGRKMLLDTQKAAEAGYLTQYRELKPGDVFVDPSGNVNRFLLVNVTYGIGYQLLGMNGTACNSGPFFAYPRSLTEVQEHLDKRNMKFAGNISNGIESLIYGV